MKTAFVAFVVLSLSLPATAREKIAVLLSGLKVAASDSACAKEYKNISDYYQYANPDSAYYYLNAGLQQFLRSNYSYGIATMTSELGNLDANAGNMDLAKKRQNDALKIFTELNNEVGIGDAESKLGVIEGKQCNFNVATKYFFSALKEYESAHAVSGIVTCYLNLGLVSSTNNDPDRALDYYNKGLNLLTDTSNVRMMCNLYNNIGIVYGRKGDLATALVYFEKAQNKSNRDEYIDVYIYSLLNTGIVYQQQGKDQAALSLLNEALRQARARKLLHEQALIIVNISTVVAQKDPALAITTINEALGIAKQFGDKSLLDDIYINLVEYNKKLGKYNEVSALLEQEISMNDSLYNVEKVKEIANLQTVYELEQSNNKIKQLNLTARANELKRNILIVTAVSLVLIIVIISFYFSKTRRYYQVVSQQKEELSLSNTVKDKLFSIIGHDLRGPVSNILMILDVLDNEDMDAEDRKEILNTLRGQTLSTMETLDTLLIWGRAQIKGNATMPEHFLVTQYLDRNMELLNVGTKQKNIQVVNKVDTNTRVYGDPAHFDLVIRNLLSNAIKFSNPGGTVTISADRERMPGYVVFAVSDHGVGIPREQCPRIFDAFSRSTNGTAGEKGTGIGLMVSKEFVVLNGGRIWVESEEGKGATFYFSFKTSVAG